MKMIPLFLFLIGIAGSARAQIATNVTAQFKVKLVCDDGKFGTSKAICPSPEGITPGTENTDAITTPGRDRELRWKFVGREGKKDVYHFTFTRMTKAGSSGKTTTSKDVLFDGHRVTVFEDDLHTVIIESPSEQDLKDIASRKRI